MSETVPHPTLQGVHARIIRGYASGAFCEIVGCDRVDSRILQVAVPLGILISRNLINRTDGNQVANNLVHVLDCDIEIVCDSLVSKENIKSIMEIV